MWYNKYVWLWYATRIMYMMHERQQRNKRRGDGGLGLVGREKTGCKDQTENKAKTSCFLFFCPFHLRDGNKQHACIYNIDRRTTQHNAQNMHTLDTSARKNKNYTPHNTPKQTQHNTTQFQKTHTHTFWKHIYRTARIHIPMYNTALRLQHEATQTPRIIYITPRIYIIPYMLHTYIYIISICIIYIIHVYTRYVSRTFWTSSGWPNFSL